MKRVLVAALLCATQAALASPQGSVVGSKHDFSSLGGGAFRAASEEQVCIFCHASHGGQAGMNNRPTRGGAGPATSAGEATRDTPDGASRLCLSCHDGTIAVGDTHVKRIAVSGPGGDRIPPGRRSNLGTDLRTSHPVSTYVRQSVKTHAPDPRDAVKLDHRGKVQCTSCHDPHRSADSGGKFLVTEGAGTQLCLSCHSQSLGAGSPSSHFAAGASFGTAQGNDAGARSVGEAGCGACHAVHGSDPRGRLLRRATTDGDDAVCLKCHSGAVARKNVASDLGKPFSHAVDGRGAHAASEGPSVPGASLPETSAGATRHSVCVDCHNPHAATDAPAIAPNAGGALAGVWGIDLAGQRVEPVRYEYEVCLKCHGDSANKPQDRPTIALGAHPPRAVPDSNLRAVFAPSAVSYHPVAAPGRSADVPSLDLPWSVASYVYCTDCHRSDAAASPTAARGPHGSVYPHLLERNYTTADNSIESPAAYALCYKCHNRDRLLFSSDATFLGTSGKNLHKVHVVEQRAPCSVCHASHGVSSRSGTATNNAHLIDFDVSVVKPNDRGDRSYASGGSRSGTCSLSCHRSNHVNVTY